MQNLLKICSKSAQKMCSKNLKDSKKFNLHNVFAFEVEAWHFFLFSMIHALRGVRRHYVTLGRFSTVAEYVTILTKSDQN